MVDPGAELSRRHLGAVEPAVGGFRHFRHFESLAALARVGDRSWFRPAVGPGQADPAAAPPARPRPAGLWGAGPAIECPALSDRSLTDRTRDHVHRLGWLESLFERYCECSPGADRLRSVGIADFVWRGGLLLLSEMDLGGRLGVGGGLHCLQQRSL